MISTQPPSAVPSSMTLYRLSSAAAIGQTLQDMRAQGAVLSLFALPAGDGVPTLLAGTTQAPLAMARIDDLDAQERRVRWQSPAAAQRLAPALLGVAHLAGGVRVQCLLQGEWSEGAGASELAAPWPAELLLLQRRRHPRFAVPLGQNFGAQFMFGSRRCEFDIDDLSQGGLALRASRAETAMLFIGRKLPRVQLQLGADLVLQADLQVRARRGYQSFLLGEQVLVGCSIEAMHDEDRLRLAALLDSGERPPQA